LSSITPITSKGMPDADGLPHRVPAAEELPCHLAPEERDPAALFDVLVVQPAPLARGRPLVAHDAVFDVHAAHRLHDLLVAEGDGRSHHVLGARVLHER
jgi:hypothetical protein